MNGRSWATSRRLQRRETGQPTTLDGETRTPSCDYLVWVVDECDSNIDTKVEIPSARWGGDVIRMRRFPVLRLRSVGDYAMNIAFHVCFTRQAKGTDIIRLFRNAVLGQPIPAMVDPKLRPVEGAGFPQNIFDQLRFVVPVVVYLDNALAHLYNDLNELVTRLFGGRVELGTPGVPKGRPEIESNIHKTRRCFVLQLPGTLGSGPQDPLRKNAERPPEKLVHANHIEQGLHCGSCPNAWCKSTARRELRCAVLSGLLPTAESAQYR